MSVLVGVHWPKHSSSAKLGVAVCKASIFNSLGGPSAKVGSSANYEQTSKPGDLPRSALTTILHITPGTYEFS